MRDYYRRFYHPGNATLVIVRRHPTRRTALRKVKRALRVPRGQATTYERMPTTTARRSPSPRTVSAPADALSWDDRGVALVHRSGPASKVGTRRGHTQLDVVSRRFLTDAAALSRMHRRKLVLEQRPRLEPVGPNNDTRVEGGASSGCSPSAPRASRRRTPASRGRSGRRSSSWRPRPIEPSAELKRAKSDARRASQSHEGGDGERTWPRTVGVLRRSTGSGSWAVDMTASVRNAGHRAAQVRDCARRACSRPGSAGSSAGALPETCDARTPAPKAAKRRAKAREAHE